MRVTERFLADVEEARGDAPDLVTGWERAVRSALNAAASDPLLGTVTGADRIEFVPVLISHRTAVIDYATDHLAGAARRRWPELVERSDRLAAEATARLAISHIVRPAPVPEPPRTTSPSSPPATSPTAARSNPRQAGRSPIADFA